jgi:hypothetical protein
MNAYLLDATTKDTPFLSAFEWLFLGLTVFTALYFHKELWSLLLTTRRWLSKSIRSEDIADLPSGAAEPPKPKGNSRPTPGNRGEMTLDSVKPVQHAQPRPADQSTANSTPPQTMKDPQPSASPNLAGELEKTFAQFGQRIDTLIAQNADYLRQVKLAEKEKSDTIINSQKAVHVLEDQLNARNKQIAEIEALLDRKSMFPSLRALIDVRKLCLDMIGTQKPLAHDDLIKFVTDEIDNQLLNLDIQTVSFPEGTPLEKIPGELVEVSQRHELTEDPSRNNQVFKMTRPCYYFERDSKRNIVAKASVTLYRYTPPASEPTPSPQTPAQA